MAGAVAYTMSMFRSSRYPIMLNLGIAGHRNFVVGSVRLAHKVLDAETDKRFFPQILPNISCASHAVKTLSKPASDYDEKFLYEMEASGFYEMAVKFSSLELIHCLKIISDNSLSSQQNIDEQKVDAWIEQHLPLLTETVRLLGRQRQSLIQPNCSGLFEQINSRYHLTASNSLKIKTLLERRRLLTGDDDRDLRIGEEKTVKDLIGRLEREIAGIDFFL